MLYFYSYLTLQPRVNPTKASARLKPCGQYSGFIIKNRVTFMTSIIEGRPSVKVLHPIFLSYFWGIVSVTFLFCFAELYEFCLKENIADANLIAKWKKQGYENLCCLRCIQTRDTNFGTSCICRVPKAKLEEVMSPLSPFL